VKRLEKFPTREFTHRLLQLPILLLQGPTPSQLGDAEPCDLLLPREKVCSPTPSQG
jgi:hypothetical protein